MKLLDEAPSVQADEIIIRFANLRDDVETLEKMELDPHERDEFLDFLSRSRVDQRNLEETIDSAFKPKPQLEERAPRPARFSDSSTRAYCASLEAETAEKECLHWYIRDALNGGHPAYYRRIECRFRGTAKDLRRKVAEWPWLVGDVTDYPKCLALAREAVASDSGIDGFFTSSARRKGGTNVPVFSRPALSEPSDRGVATFCFDASTGEVVVSHRERIEP